MHDTNSVRLLGRDLSRVPGIRTRVVLAVSLAAVLSFLVAAGVLLWHAQHERHILLHQGLSASVAAVNAIDREAEALGNTLRGLSRSPLLDAEDLKPFYRQLVATPRPEGSRFLLWNSEKQLINTAVPFGDSLPPIVDPPIREERLALLRRVGLVLSERVKAPLDGQWVVAVSLLIEASDGRSQRILTLSVPEAYFSKIARAAGPSDQWRTLILDRRLQMLRDPDSASPEPLLLSQVITDRLAGKEPNGHFEVGGYWAAFHRSGSSEYIAVSIAPAAAINAPVTQATYRIALAGAILLLIGGASASMLIRTGGPVDALQRDAALSRSELAAANARMSEILGSISDCYFTLDRNYRIADVNATALRWWRLEEGAIVGRSYFDTIGRDPSIDAALAQVIGERREFRGVLPSLYHPGRYIDYRVYPSPQGATVFFSDVTDRYEIHRTTLREREFLQASLDALTAHVAILDESGTIIAVNEAWHRFARDNNYRNDSHSFGANYLDVCQAARHDGMVEERIFRGIEALITGQCSEFQALYPCPSQERFRWFQLRAARFIAGENARVVVTYEDITDVISARAEIGELSERLLVLQEEERRRIAAELHDSTAQHLVAVGLNLMQVEALGLPPAGQRILEAVDRSLEEALKELRIFTYLLHPPGLETDGLAGTIQAFAEGFADRTGLNVTIRMTGAVDSLSSNRQRALFRIVQEGLANVHRHAKASRAVLSLSLTPDEAILCIGDDGRGMRVRRRDAVGAKSSLGVGIPGMRIRLSQFGGSLRIRSNRRGTVVRAAVPRDVGSRVETELVRIS
jgi:two-component system, NarL family, sensor kinase